MSESNSYYSMGIAFSNRAMSCLPKQLRSIMSEAFSEIVFDESGACLFVVNNITQNDMVKHDVLELYQTLIKEWIALALSNDMIDPIDYFVAYFGDCDDGTHDPHRQVFTHGEYTHNPFSLGLVKDVVYSSPQGSRTVVKEMTAVVIEIENGVVVNARSNKHTQVRLVVIDHDKADVDTNNGSYPVSKIEVLPLSVIDEDA